MSLARARKMKMWAVTGASALFILFLAFRSYRSAEAMVEQKANDQKTKEQEEKAYFDLFEEFYAKDNGQYDNKDDGQYDNKDDVRWHDAISLSADPAFQESICLSAEMQVALAVVVLVSSVVHVAILVRPFRNFFSVVVQSCWSSTRRVTQAILCFWQAPQDPEDELVQKEIDNVRLQFACKLKNLLNCLVLPLGLFLSVFILATKGMDIPVSSFSPATKLELLDRWHTWIIEDIALPTLALLSVALTVYSAKPQWFTSMALDCWLVMLSCMWLWWTFSMSPRSLDWQYTPSFMPRIVMAMVCSNRFLFTGVLLASFIADSAIRRVLYRYNSIGDFLVEVGQAAMVIALCWALHKVALSAARARVQARQTSITNTLVRRLLDSMCDAVVLVNADFDIGQPSPKLAGLLLHRAMPTQHFTGLMHPDDREGFLEHMAREARLAETSQLDDGPAAFALHVRLRDANGSNVPVELFCSCIPDANTGLLQYMVGVKEEGLRLEEPAVSLGPAAAVPVAPAAPVVYVHTNTTDDSSDVSSLPDDAGEMCAWIDPLDADLRVLCHTPGFTALSGPSVAGVELLQWFSDNARFLAFFQGKANEWAASGQSGSFALSGVTFSPPSLKPFGIRLKGTVTLSFGLVEDSDWACVSFFDVQLKHKALGRKWDGTPWAGTPPVVAAEGHLRSSTSTPTPSGERLCL